MWFGSESALPTHQARAPPHFLPRKVRSRLSSHQRSYHRNRRMGCVSLHRPPHHSPDQSHRKPRPPPEPLHDRSPNTPTGILASHHDKDRLRIAYPLPPSRNTQPPPPPGRHTPPRLDSLRSRGEVPNHNYRCAPHWYRRNPHRQRMPHRSHRSLDRCTLHRPRTP